MKILLVDDHQMLREGLRATLAREADFAIVGEAGDGHAAIAAARALQPDVVVMDISMPGLNGLEATRHILAESPGIKVIGLSMHSDRRYVHAAFEAGASGYLLKNGASDELVVALRAVARGQHYVSPAVAGLIVEGFVAGAASAAAAPPVELSSREREVLQLLAEGNTSKDVAARLGVAVSTVETHRRQISTKLNIHSIAGLTKYAIRHGLTSVE
jgi:DNA-binding NarL/FixJ family response regulator